MISYLFNCVDAFNEDLDCNFIFSDATEMAQAVESAKKLTVQEFQEKCLKILSPESFVANFSLILKDVEFFELTVELNSEHCGIFVMYDTNQDIHYFFEK